MTIGNVPVKKLVNGDSIPAIGLGTFGSDKYSGQQIAEAVVEAASVGYRHFDCASVYRNEPEIGGAIRRILQTGIEREELWITSKVWNDKHDSVFQSCEESLKNLGLAYLDLLLVHWPFPNHHAPGVGVDSRDPHAVPYDRESYMKTWRQMEALVESGLVRHIGTSNMTISKLKGVIEDSVIKPEVNEMELHPHFQQPALFEFVIQNGIIPVGYSPIGSPSRPERDRTPEDTVDTLDPVIIEIAARHEIFPAAVCILWQVARGSIPIPFSVKKSQFEPVLEAVCSISLSNDELEAISKIDKQCRLIKGQVFLWESAKDWTELWDGEA